MRIRGFETSQKKKQTKKPQLFPRLSYLVMNVIAPGKNVIDQKPA